MDTTEIDSEDLYLLFDVEGEREYEHDTLNMPTPRLIVCMKIRHALFEVTRAVSDW